MNINAKKCVLKWQYNGNERQIKANEARSEKKRAERFFLSRFRVPTYSTQIPLLSAEPVHAVPAGDYPSPQVSCRETTGHTIAHACQPHAGRPAPDLAFLLPPREVVFLLLSCQRSSHNFVQISKWFRSHPRGFFFQSGSTLICNQDVRLMTRSGSPAAPNLPFKSLCLSWTRDETAVCQVTWLRLFRCRQVSVLC